MASGAIRSESPSPPLPMIAEAARLRLRFEDNLRRA
jgi:hypothetical protein